MPKRPTRLTDEKTQTPPEARTDSNVTRIPLAGGRVRKAVSSATDRGRSAFPSAAQDEAAARSDDDLTADALRHALDRGEGGDKIDFMDPAATPLGTDDEAAGHPPTREQIIEAARHELGPSRSPEEKRHRRTIPLRVKDGMGLGLVVIAAILAVLLVVLALGSG